MIADHDFERKMSDVKKYLERGDMVKVSLMRFSHTTSSVNLVAMVAMVAMV